MSTNTNTNNFSDTEIKNSTRTLSILSALLFLSFSVVDIWAIKSVLTEVLVIRGFVTGLLLLSYLTTFSSSFSRISNFVMPLDIVVASAGIEYMIFLASPSDHAYSVYFVGLVLILMTLYSWTYIKFITAVVITCAILAGYIYIELFTRPEGANLSAPELVTNLFFIVSSIVIGIVARMMRDRYIRENYLLQQSLTKALEAKTEEAEDYQFKANHDPLTGLPNRRYAESLLEESLKVAKDKDRVLVIMFVDLNGFKQINDIHGHAAGDEVLTIVAKRLELAVRKSDCLARIGGDEYLIGLLLDRENIAEVEHMAEKFTTIIGEPMNVEGTIFEVGASIGIAAFPYHSDKVQVLMDIADQKMYQTKHNIKDTTDSTVVFFENSNA